MTNFGLPDLEFVLYNGYNITGQVRSLKDEIENVVEERDVAAQEILGRHFVGLQMGSVDLTSFYDSDISPYLEAEPGESVLMYAIEGNVLGRHCECASGALKANYKRLMEAKGLHKGEIKFHAQGATTIDHAFLVADLVARTAASGNTDASDVDGLAETTGGGRFYVTTTALTLGGYTNLQVQLRDSSDAITYANIAGAVATFTAIGGQVITVAGTIKQYVSAAWAYTGAGSGQSATFAAAVHKIA